MKLLFNMCSAEKLTQSNPQLRFRFVVLLHILFLCNNKNNNNLCFKCSINYNFFCCVIIQEKKTSFRFKFLIFEIINKYVVLNIYIVYLLLLFFFHMFIFGEDDDDVDEFNLTFITYVWQI